MEENKNTEMKLQQEEKAEVVQEMQSNEEPLTPSEREELEQLREEKARNMKEKLYDKVTVSVKTMDRIIAGLVILFLVVVIAGMIAGK